MEILHNNCKFYGELALCGTRGWFYELDNQGTHNEKVLLREIGRLETFSEGGGGARRSWCFLHYPPLYQGYRCPEILRLLQRVRREAVLLRPSARRFPPPGHRGNVGRNGVFAGVGGLSEICSQKNLRMMQKRCGN